MSHRIDLTGTRPILPELIPKTMWGKNVRAVISRQNWDALRWSFGATKFPHWYATSAATELGLMRPRRDEEICCQICSQKQDNLELHELWEYDDKQNVQKLVGLVSVCEDCHLSLHLGFASTANMAERAQNHLIKLNRWSKAEAKQRIRDIFTTWRKRSQHEYQLNIDYLKQWFPDTKIHFDWLNDTMRWAGNRLEAISWSQHYLNSDAIIIDTETTGLLEKPNVEVIELAILDMKGQILYSSRFRPKYKIPKRVIAIHGITNDDVAEEPTFREEYNNILDVMNSKTVIAYNAKFDRGVLGNTCKLFKLTPPDCKWQCAMQVFRAFKESGKWLPLPDAQHNAIDDCKAALDVINKIAKEQYD